MQNLLRTCSCIPSGNISCYMQNFTQTLHCTQATFTTALARKKLFHDWNSGKSLLNLTKPTLHPHYTSMVTHSCMFDFVQEKRSVSSKKQRAGWP